MHLKREWPDDNFKNQREGKNEREVKIEQKREREIEKGREKKGRFISREKK